MPKMFNETQLIKTYYEIKNKIITLISMYPQYKKELIQEMKIVRNTILKNNKLKELRNLVFQEKKNEYLSVKQ